MHYAIVKNCSIVKSGRLVSKEGLLPWTDFCWGPTLHFDMQGDYISNLFACSVPAPAFKC